MFHWHISQLGPQALKTAVVGRGRVFSIFGELRHDPPSAANLDLTLGATCPEADPSCFSHCFFPCFPVRCGVLHEDVLPRGLRQPADFPTSVASSSWCVIGRIRPRRSSYLRAKHCLPNFEMLSSQLAFPGFGEPWILQSFCWSFPAPQGETSACPWRSICDSIPAGLRRSWYSCQWRRNSLTNKDRKYMTRWWFQRFFIFNPTWGNHPI